MLLLDRENKELKCFRVKAVYYILFYYILILLEFYHFFTSLLLHIKFVVIFEIYVPPLCLYKVHHRRLVSMSTI